MGSPRCENENDAADHQDAADPFAEGRSLLEDEARGDEREDELDLADGAHQGGILERHGECPTGRAHYAEDADPDRRAPIVPHLAELRPVTPREVESHQ